MPGANLTLTVSSILDGNGFKDLAAQVREAGVGLDKVQTSGSNVNQIFSELKNIVGVLGVVEFLKKAAEESANNEQTQMRLKTAVENSGKSWDKQSSSISAYLSNLSAVSKFSETELQNAFTVLLNRTHDVTVSQNLLKTAMGINISTGKDLVQTSEALGTAANGNVFGLRELSREFGITGTNAKNAEVVLKILQERFDKTAKSEDSALKSGVALKNSFMDFLGSVGDIVNSVLKPIEKVFQVAFLGLSGAIQIASATVKAFYAIVTGGDGKAANAQFKKFQETAEKIRILFGKDIPEASNKGGKVITDNARALSVELKNILDGLNKETLQMNALTVDQKVANLMKETDNEKRIIRERADFQILTEKQKEQVLRAIDENASAKKLQLVKETAKKIVDNTNQYLSIIGTAVGASLTGQKDAWKIALGAIIDALAAQISAQIAMVTAAHVATDLLTDDYASAAKHAAIGGLEIGAVAAIASGAKGLLNPGSTDNSINAAATGGSSASSSASTAAVPAQQAPAPKQSHVSVVVQGSVVGDVNELARRISDAVQNRNVRLVATQVKGGA